MAGIENLGENIRVARKARDLSQEAVARRANLSLNVVARIELGIITNPHYSTLSAIASALDTSVAELVGEKQPEVSTTGKVSAPPKPGPTEAEEQAAEPLSPK